MELKIEGIVPDKNAFWNKVDSLGQNPTPYDRGWLPYDHGRPTYLFVDDLAYSELCGSVWSYSRKIEDFIADYEAIPLPDDDGSIPPTAAKWIRFATGREE